VWLNMDTPITEMIISIHLVEFINVTPVPRHVVFIFRRSIEITAKAVTLISNLSLKERERNG